jgi:hypothetical protein
MKPLEVRCADLNRSESDCLALTQTVPTGFRPNHLSAARRRAQQEQSPCATLRQKTSRRLPDGPRNFLGGKTDNSDVTVESEDKRTIPGDPRLRHAYPYFRMHLEEIAACVEGGCSVRSVWRAYATRTPEPFPGSYSSFLRYCTDHGLAPRRANAGTDTAANRRGVAPPAQRPDRTPPLSSLSPLGPFGSPNYAVPDVMSRGSRRREGL